MKFKLQFVLVVIAFYLGIIVIIVAAATSVAIYVAEKNKQHEEEVSALDAQQWNDYVQTCEYKNSQELFSKEFKAKYKIARS